MQEHAYKHISSQNLFAFFLNGKANYQELFATFLRNFALVVWVHLQVFPRHVPIHPKSEPSLMVHILCYGHSCQSKISKGFCLSEKAGINSLTAAYMK